MAWTREQKLSALLRLPWSIRSEHIRGDAYWVGRVAEIPSAIGTGDSPAELERDLWDSFRASLEVYLDRGDPIPLPPGVSRLPWERGTRPPQPSVVMATYERGEIWSSDVTASTESLVITPVSADH